LSNPSEVIVTDVTPDNRTLLQFDGAVGVSAANAANRTGTILQIQVIDRFEQILYSDIQRFYVAEIVVAPGFGSDVQVHFNRQSTSNITSTRSIYPTPIRGPPSWNVTLNAPSRQPVVISSMTVIKGVWFSDQRDNNYRGKPIGFGFIVACVFGGIVFVAVVVGVVIFIVRRRRALAVTIL
jgi:hypothetical protein